MTTQELAHAELGASSAERWMNCGGSIRLSRGLPEISSAYSEEGDTAHYLANQCLVRRTNPQDYLGLSFQGYVGEVDEEMADAVRVFVDEVRIELAKDPASQGFFEKTISLAPLDPPGPMFGTSDAFVFSPTRRRLTVFDLKYGAGVVVEVKDNAQARYYALGALILLEQLLGHGLVDEIEVVIVQPRAYHRDGIIRRETVAYIDLLDFAGAILERAEAALVPDTPLKPGPWCRFCRAAGVCPALQAEAQEAAMVAFGGAPLDAPPKPEILPNPVLAEVLDQAPIIEGWLRAVRATVQAKLEAGEEVPGWKLVAKRATRRWVSENRALDFAVQMGLERAQLMETVVRSPAQFERLLKSVNAELPEALYTKQSSGNTIAPAADTRQEVAPGTLAASAFAATPLALPPATTDPTAASDPQPSVAPVPAIPEPAASTAPVKRTRKPRKGKQ